MSTEGQTFACAMRADGWVRDQSGAWHEPGHPYPVVLRMSVDVTWTRDWRALARLVWAWARGRPATLSVNLNQTVWFVSTPPTVPPVS